MTPSITIEGERDLIFVAAALAVADKLRSQSGRPPAPGSVEIQAAIKATLECTAVQLESEQMGQLGGGTELTVKEVSELLGVSRSTITRNAHKYHGRRRGPQWVFPADYLHDLIGSNEC